MASQMALPIINAGIGLPPVQRMGGIREFWVLGGTISSYGPFSSPSTYFDPSLGATGLTSISSVGTWYYYATPKDTAKWDQKAMINPENGTIFYEQTFIADLYFPSTANDILLQAVTINRFLKLVIKDRNNQYWCMGFDNGAQVKSLDNSSGTKPGDKVNYIITFVAEEMNPAYYLGPGDFIQIAAAGGASVQSPTVY